MVYSLNSNFQWQRTPTICFSVASRIREFSLLPSIHERNARVTCGVSLFALPVKRRPILSNTAPNTSFCWNTLSTKHKGVLFVWAFVVGPCFRAPGSPDRPESPFNGEHVCRKLRAAASWKTLLQCCHADPTAIFLSLMLV
jgi:hypothetical protein